MLVVAEEQVLADRNPECLLDFLALLHSECRLVAYRFVLDAKRIQKIIGPDFHLAPSLVAVGPANIMCNHTHFCILSVRNYAEISFLQNSF